MLQWKHPGLLKTWGGGGSAGGGGGGGIGSLAGRGGGVRATHYYHMHTSRGCLGAWGYGGMYAIIAISCLCQEESLRVLRTKGIVPLSTKHGTKKLAPLAPWPPHCYLSKLGGLKWSGCSVRIWLWLRLPHSCHRHLSNLPMFGGASARGLFSSSSLVPVSARCIRFLGSTGLCVHPGQWSLPSRGAAVAGPIRPH